jgi:WD40 repeat protein
MRRHQMRLQFSLISLFGLVVVVALACAALVNASPLWASASYTVTLLFLLTATLAAVFRPQNRAFWLGFIVFGWAYLFFTFGPWVGGCVAPPLSSGQGLVYLESKLAREDGSLSSVPFLSDGRLIVSGSGPGTIRLWNVATAGQPQEPFGWWVPGARGSFHQIGHSVVSLVMALLGGILACWLRSKPTTPADSQISRP